MHGTINTTTDGVLRIHTYTAPDDGWEVNSHIIELATQAAWNTARREAMRRLESSDADRSVALLVRINFEKIPAPPPER